MALCRIRARRGRGEIAGDVEVEEGGGGGGRGVAGDEQGHDGRVVRGMRVEERAGGQWRGENEGDSGMCDDVLQVELGGVGKTPGN